MRPPDHEPSGPPLCRWAAGALLAALSLSVHARNDARYDGFTWAQDGSGAGRVQFGGTGTPLQTSPPSPAAATRVGNMNFAHPNGGWPHAAGTVRVPAGAPGKYFDVPVKQSFTKPSIGKLLAAGARIAGPIAIGMALFDVLQEVGVTPTQQNGENTFTVAVANIGYCQGDNSTTTCIAGQSPTKTTPQQVCSDMEAAYNAQYNTGPMGYTFVVTYYPPGSSPNAGPYGWCDRQGYVNNSGAATNFGRGQPYVAGVATGGTTNVPRTEQQVADLIAAKSGWPSSSQIDTALAQTINNPGLPPIVALETLTAGINFDGPAPAPLNVVERVSTSSDGSTETDTSSCALVLSGDGSGTVTRKCTITTTKSTPQPDGSTKTETKVSEGAQIEKEKDEVRDEYDTPTGEIPKKTVSLSYAAEVLGFGSGTCPSPITHSLGGQTVTVYSYAKACDLLSNTVKPLVLVLAAWIAFVILMPGGAGTRSEA